MAPGFGDLPAAERDGDVSGPVARLLAELPPHALARIRLGLRAFEWLPFPWRFSRQDLAAREDFLEKMEGSSLRVHQDLLLLAKVLCTLGYSILPEVQRVVGYDVTCAVADEGDAAPAEAGEEALGETEPPSDIEECDVVIIGSGAGGAAAAATLAEAGVDVLVLEAGGHHTRETYPRDPIDSILSLYRDAGLTIAEGKPPIPIPVAKAVGGTTVINSGTCFRAPDGVLGRWEAEHGVDWAGDLGAEYAESEEFLRVKRVDAARMGRNGQLAMEGAAAMGVSAAPIARNAGSCFQCSACPFGCVLDAKRAMHVSYLPRAVAAGARVRANVDVQQVITEGGKAVGVDAVHRKGRPAEGGPRRYRVRARRAVIVAGGALGTPELLLRSGLGGAAVGRNLHIHPACWVGARYEEEVRGWEGIMQSYYIDEWEPRSILLEATFTPLPFGGAWLLGTGRRHQEAMLGFDRIGSIGVHLSDDSAGRIRLARDGTLRAKYSLTGEDAGKLVYGIARAAEVHFAAGASEVYPNVGGISVLRPGDVPALENARLGPGDLRLEAFHPMGTARIGPDGANGGGSVCRADGSVRGTERLYVADASLFPTSVGVNPMMTIIAFAKRIAAGLAA